MIARCLAILLVCILGSEAKAQPPAPKEINLVSDVWEQYSEADGSGLAWDVLRAVYEPVGVKLNIQTMPYTRSIGLVQRGEADAWVGSYLDEVQQGVFYPHWNYDADQITALSTLATPVPNLQTLNQYRLVWVRGYAYQQYLPNLTRFREVQRRNGILEMLNFGRADYYIDARTEVEQLLMTAPDPAHYRVTVLTRLPIYLGFADNPRGHQLADLFDQRMQVLVEQGTLKPIFQRWKQPYPFD
ncbi:substrate-binding periplasmic protein [Pseudomonas sp. S9]|uniref:substrate-binding periplasmic protein n=1 Tax=Pseudomonas sp. S9 TaxID=686578 RepID=UPI00025570D9|nr:transporter substrate-binding domain-containing protein [Pseudomonas sp. S9]